jgi:peptide/nickel transport system permease protein
VIAQPTLPMARPGVARPRPAANPRRRLLLRIGRSSAAVVGGTAVLLFVAMGLVALVFTPYDPTAMALGQALQSPSAAHWFGTDDLGRDLLSRIMRGSTTSLGIAVGGVSVALLVGVTLGAVSGYAGGWLDNVLMRCIDVLLAVPGMLLALIIVSVLGVGTGNLIVAVGIFSVPGFARITRGAVLSLRAREFVQAARCLGASSARLLARHILPNASGPIIVQATLRTATAILTASSLSFLGLGAQPPEPEWGLLLAAARDHLQSSPHLAIFPGVALATVVLGFNLLGDGLADALDPRSDLAARTGAR